MTSKLKCPFCQHDLRKLFNKYTGEPNYDYECGNHNCDLYGIEMPETVWQALIQTKQDLEFFKEEQDRSATALIERTKELDKCQKDLRKANAELDYIKEQVEKRQALYNARKALETIGKHNE